MFTGIIEGLGTVTAVTSSGEGRRLSINADFVLEDSRMGDSIAIDGACLTAVMVAGTRFAADVSPETLARTTLQTITPGTRVNIERALRLSDRLDGHLVSGHIDGTGRIAFKKTEANALRVGIFVAPELNRYMIAKGSVAVDGVSLTINTLDSQGFEVAIIPHTAASTTIETKHTGDAVNIETDMIGKYVEKFIKEEEKNASDDKPETGVDMGLLHKTGFI
ncbi:MAG: riboflavin synthase [Desulfobacterales bacterium]|nr:riboflavin synthase [Desulfobacterales bacterium]